MNPQTSFLPPPLGYALFYLRSVVAKFDCNDRVTGKLIPAVKTTEIYTGEIAFIALQLIMLITVIAFPVLVAGGIEKEDRLIKEQIMKADIASDSSETPTPTEDDPMKAMLDAYN